MKQGKAAQPSRFLLVTWQVGGASQPEFGLCRLLAARGHTVRVLAPTIHRARIEAAGCEWRPFPPGLEFDSGKGRALEDDGQTQFVVDVFCGMTLAEALLIEIERDRPDVVLVDYMLRSTLSAAESARLPTVALVHTCFRFHGATDVDWDWGWDYEPVNESRAKLGIPVVPKRNERLCVALQRRCDRALALMTAEFDERNVTFDGLAHIGPIFEEDGASTTWDSPWSRDHPDPLVVVSMSTQYMHHEDALGQALDALDDLPVRVLATTGYELEPSEVRSRPSAVVERYVPHVAVLPEAALVVTHAGLGTVMAAFAYGVPLVCMPLGRDQPGNAQRVAELGAGLVIAPDASRVEIRSACEQALASGALREGGNRMAAVVERYGRGARGVSELERLLRARRTVVLD